MRSKKWLKIFLFLSTLGVAFVSIINYVVDPFNIFHTNILKIEFQQNERFIKIEYLEKNNEKFNGYIFGSSRVGTTVPIVVEKYIANSSIYNFTISGANLYDYEKHLAYFINQKYPIKTLYLQIDLDNMAGYGRDPNDYLMKAHPYVSGQSLINYYKMYLTGFFPVNIKLKIEKNIDNFNPINYKWNIGSWNIPSKDKLIDKNCNKFVNSVPSFNTHNQRIITYSKRVENINSLLEIKKLSDDNNIDLIVFITPHNQNMMDSFVIDQYLEFLSDISKIVSFYDFSGYNSITTNNCNYYESSHYLPTISKLIAAKIFNDKETYVPTDFGIYVNEENIIKHLHFLKEQIQTYDSKKLN